MSVVVPFEHKQIAYIAYHPEKKTVEIIFHRGECRLLPAVDSERFQMLLLSDNKVDALSLLLSR